ncbi:hypothetical protein LXA43DRAFT_351971 [Ganoderma leucocontextum]|nr:hypothetical protein LXA43DRAFT_351971 [Ganoderma leucocontextum]
MVPPYRKHATSNGSYRKGVFFPKNPAGPPTIRYWCNLCDHSVARVSDVRRHMLIHSNTFKFICNRSGCRQVGGGVGFHQRSNLKTHLKNAHAPGNKFACPQLWRNITGSTEACPVRCKTQQGLLKHRTRAHGFNLGDDVSKAQVPTPEGTRFPFNRSHGRGGSPPGAVIYFPNGRDDDCADSEANFVQDVYSRPEELKEFLSQRGLPYPTLPFDWPIGSFGGRPRTTTRTTTTTTATSPGPMATPEQHHQIASSSTTPTAAQPLPYPLTTYSPAFDISSLAADQVSQQEAIDHFQPHAWYPPFLTQPLATGSSAPPLARPAPAQNMAVVGGWAIAPQATNLGYSHPDDVLAPQLQLPAAFDGTIDSSVSMAPITLPSYGEMDVLNAGGLSSSSRFYGPDTRPAGGENDASSGPSKAELDYQFFLELSKWFPDGGKGFIEFVLACQAQLPLA